MRVHYSLSDSWHVLEKFTTLVVLVFDPLKHQTLLCVGA